MHWRNKAVPKVGTLPTVEVQVAACRRRELFLAVDGQPNDLAVLTILGQPTKVKIRELERIFLSWMLLAPHRRVITEVRSLPMEERVLILADPVLERCPNGTSRADGVLWTVPARPLRSTMWGFSHTI